MPQAVVPLDLATEAYRVAVALGIGLLIGLERERRKAERQGAAEGIRTFALVALAGAIAATIGSDVALLTGGAIIGALVVAAYLANIAESKGITTEVAVVLTYLLGALALHEPILASAAGVVTAMLLAFRRAIHEFVRSTLSESELRDLLIFASAALVVMPLLPDRALDVYGVVNPAAIWRIVVLFMAISGAGYVAVRFLGARAGLPAAGFFAGFVSSAAAVGSMAGIARRTPALLPGAVAGAVLASVASLAFLLVLVAATNVDALRALAIPLGSAIVAATAYAALVAIRSLRTVPAEAPTVGRAFDLRSAIAFAVAVTLIELASAFITQQFGSSGFLIASALAGFADTHAAAISAASLVTAGKVTPEEAALAIAAALTTNQLTKGALAISLARGRYAVLVIVGLAVMLAATWAGAIVGAIR